VSSDDISSILEKLKFLLGDEIFSDEHWRAFLDEVGRYGKTVEREARALRASTKVLLAIIDLIPVAFFVKDHESRFFLMNRACEEQWGLSFAQLRGTDGSQFFPPDQMEQFLATDRAIFESRKSVEFEETFWSAAEQGDRIGQTFKRPMYDTNGDPQYLVCVTLDITEQKITQTKLADSEKRLQALSTTDFLTDLPNHRQFTARLADEFDRVQRFAGQHGSVLMLDLDLFKEINDTHGHATGDAVLKHFAQLVRNALRKIDIAGRVGGEEFAIILPGTGSAGAQRFAERLREAVASIPLVQDGKTISVTVSIGVATMGPPDSNGEDTLLRSDEALYRAKKNGRNRVEFDEGLKH
jgi:diguanylate cyclase (GGDEF)-like protein/PAS domain S-box-containing protein